MAIAVKTGQNSHSNNTSVYVATSDVIAEVTMSGNRTVNMVNILRHNTSQLSSLKIFNANRLNNGK